METNRKLGVQKRKEAESKNEKSVDQPVKKAKKLDDAENKAPEKINPNELLGKADEFFLVKHPKELLSFWERAISLNQNSPTDAYSELKSLKLVGPFVLLEDLKGANSSIEDGKNYLTKFRYSTDLPEMETLMIYRGGRFCYWRDNPDELPSYIVHVANKPNNFPVFTIAGDANPFSALAYLLMNDGGGQSKKFNHLFAKEFDFGNYGPKLLQNLKIQRKKNSLGNPFHEFGIKVEVNDKDIGYRPVTDNLKRFRNDVEQLGSTESEAEKKLLKEGMFKIYSYVQFANDEMDFGMGLEFGHDLFMSNYECFDGMAKSVLATAYGLLGRNKFATILLKQWEHGRRANDDQLLN